jgi:hypothetical protein
MHWRSWLDDIVYDAENFNFCSLVNKLDRDGVSSVTVLQDVLKDAKELKVLKTDSTYVLAILVSCRSL